MRYLIMYLAKDYSKTQKTEAKKKTEENTSNVCFVFLSYSIY